MLHRKALLLTLGLWSMAATAQVPVVEAGGGGQTQAQAQTQSEGNQLLLTLYTQLEALQREVQTLRGMVEEQSNELRRLQTDQRDRYIDVDRRLSELSGAASTAPAFPGADSGVGVDNLPQATTGGALQLPPPANGPQGLNNNTPATFGNAPTPGIATAGTQPPAPTGLRGAEAQLSEQDLYRTALNLLLEENQYDESIRLFQGYIERFPQGRLFTNALYWQGEALILVERYDQARDVFMRLINSYPDDPKAAGAMLKLGVVYQRMGNQALADQTWRDIAVRYPDNATEIREAQSRMSGR